MISRQIKEAASWFLRMRGTDGRREKDRLFHQLRHRTMQDHFDSMSVLVMVGLAIMNVVLLCLAPLAVRGDVHVNMTIVRAVSLIGIGLFFLLRQWNVRVARGFSNVWVTCIGCASPYFVHLVAVSGQPGTLGASTSILLLNSFLLCLIVIGPTRYAFIAGAMMLTSMHLSFRSPVGLFDKYLVIVSGAMLGALIVSRITLAMVTFNVTRETLRSLDLLPRDVLRVENELDHSRVGESLRPRLTGVVCLASDWRGYQSMTRSLTPPEITDLLGRYYEICHRLLGQNAGKVRFASDWIADELLVYFLFDDEAEEKAATVAAVTFARDLIVEKKSLVLKGGGVVSIDIGIASGHSLVGLTGVEGRQKLMAIGPVLGEARRLQSRGKVLREREGQKDRIITTERVASAGSALPGELVINSALAVA